MHFFRRKNNDQRIHKGFTLLIALLVTSIVLAIGIAILNITIREFLLSGVARESQTAFFAADAGMECALYWDGTARDRFDVIPTTPGTIDCGGGAVLDGIGGSSVDVGGQATGTANTFWIQWGSPELCAQISVTKHDNTTLGTCPVGVMCTAIVSRGYSSCDLNAPRTVERALQTRY